MLQLLNYYLGEFNISIIATDGARVVVAVECDSANEMRFISRPNTVLNGITLPPRRGPD